jgi:predicted signal transduction protein with EAL and GGDEF domain
MATASRIAACVREADTPARLGGDEFAVLLEGAADEEAAVEVARRLCDSLRPPLQLDGERVVLGASVGVVVADEGGSADELLRAADVALYRAKETGKGRVERFAPALAAAPERCPGEELRGALDRGELTVGFRPVIGLGSGRLREVTALPCWPHPERGVLTADDLQPLASGSSALAPLTAWVLDEACRQVRRWAASSAAGAGLRLGVSLSSAQLALDGLVDQVIDALQRHALSADRLIIGVSERTVVEHGESARARLADLRRLGASISVEGFGTGYSSLASLRRTPVDRLAVDASFVDGLGRPGLEGAMAEAVVALARSLRLEAVADGITTDAQVAALVAGGCRLGWGPRFAPSLDAAEVGDLLASGAAVRAEPALV